MIDDLRVVHAEERRIIFEDHAGGNDGAGQAATPHFVGAGDRAKTKIAEPALDH